MFGIIKRLKRTKTLWICISAIVTAIGLYLAGAIDFGTMMQMIATAITALVVRDGIQKVIKPEDFYQNRRVP